MLVACSLALLATGKGVIVDSGTTDTYLPRTVAAAFKNAFKKACGREYGNVKMTLSDKDLAGFPTLGFVFHDAAGKEVQRAAYLFFLFLRAAAPAVL